MHRFIFSCLSGLMFCAVAAADITDLRELESGGQPAIFIGFDDAPALLDSRINGRVIELDLAGQRTGSRRIEAAGGRWIRAIDARPAETGQQIRIELQAGADGLDVIATESGYRLSWTSIAAENQLTIAANTSPADDRAAPAPAPALSGSLPDNDPPESGEGPAGESVAADAPRPTPAEEACAQAAGAVETDPWDIDALTRHAECLLAAGQAEDATVLLERVIAFEPGRFDAIIALAEARSSRGDIEAARALYEQAASVAATDGQAIAARARARALSD